MKKQKKEKKQYDLLFDNLAIPEIHTGIQENKKDDEQTTGSVTYDTVAVPEVHIRKKQTKF